MRQMLKDELKEKGKAPIIGAGVTIAAIVVLLFCVLVLAEGLNYVQ